MLESLEVGCEYNHVRLAKCEEASVEKKGKISQSSHHFALKLGSVNYYPPEGHTCVLLDSKCEEEKRFIFLGGSRTGEPASIPFSSNLVEVRVKLSEDDVEIMSAVTCRTSGSTIPYLQSHGMAARHTGDILVWGGLDLSFNSTSSKDLYVIKETSKSAKSPSFDITTVQLEESATPSKKGKLLCFQGGNVPSGRAGHTFTKIGNDKFVVFGGYKHRDCYLPGQGDRFTPSCDDGKFYLLDGDNYRWNHIASIPEVKGRCFHSAAFMEDTGELVLVGGVQYEGAVPIKRMAINEAMILSTSFISGVMTFSLRNVILDMSPLDITFLSFHSCTILNNQILVIGGYHQEDERNTDYNQSPNISSAVYVLDPMAKTCKKLQDTVSDDFATAGHTSHVLEEDCVIVMGGTSKQFCLLTGRDFTPPSCELPECNIEDRDDQGISWIDCDKCKKWFHRFCVKLKRAPKKYICPLCKARR
ncbi:uncharacterized protein [Diadema setosum]|uniref:uncharacterized protein n=1 Tax=Diadema setosum TaxID=31175 RepID=UPI003B3B4E62